MKQLGEYTVEDFIAGDRVTYVPGHAHGSLAHPDCEHGKVTSVNEKYVFVRFDGQIGDTNPSCKPSDLVKPS